MVSANIRRVGSNLAHQKVTEAPSSLLQITESFAINVDDLLKNGGDDGTILTQVFVNNIKKDGHRKTDCKNRWRPINGDQNESENNFC